MLFLAAFGAGLELSQMTKRKQTNRFKSAVYGLCIAIIVLGGAWLAHVLEPVFP